MFSRRVWATVRVHADGLVTRHARRAAPLKGGDPMTNRDHLAHSVGFEPTDVSACGFQDRCHKPLDQLCMNPRITRPGTALVFLRPRTSPPTSGGGAVKSRSPRPLIPLPVIHRVAQPVGGATHLPPAYAPGVPGCAQSLLYSKVLHCVDLKFRQITIFRIWDAFVYLV